MGIRATLASALLLLLGVQCQHVVADEGGCTEITDADDLRRLARDSNVFVAIGIKDKTDETYDEICRLLEMTPPERLGGDGLIMGRIAVSEPGYDDSGNLVQTNRDLARSLGASDESSYPAYVLVKRGAMKLSDPSTRVTYDGDDPDAVAGIGEFLSKHAGVGGLGNLVYHIHVFDRLASRFVAIDDDDTLAIWHRKGLAWIATLMRLALFRSDDSRPLAAMYEKAFYKTLEKGRSYCEDQANRIEKILGKEDGSSISLSKKEEMAQKLHILKRFTEPVEVTAEDNRSFYFSLFTNVALLVTLLWLIILSLFPGDDEEDEKEAKEGESGEGKESDQPAVDAATVDDDGAEDKKDQ